ncbi:3'(2'),5'-bisphosphate nucleotidase [Coemansia asiatica]|uniref:3'(2'),5'-bisphosphate nucleotidase n=1 Tax=Coemansia asiatica TaxID=1052880 RepID=A0A9W7XPB3_9FUNG|nr:3'(2'),5'-bisphosphate nucleotidase [Coemansia asiatica]
MSSGNLLLSHGRLSARYRYSAQRVFSLKRTDKATFSNQLLVSRPLSSHIATTYLAKERAVAIEAVECASKVCQSVFKRLVAEETLTKNDKSPVTVADFGAQAVVNSILEKHFPQDPIVGEEDSKDLHGDQGRALREKVVELVNTATETPMSSDEVLRAIDRGQYAGGSKGRHWTLDPIDGTKGFLRGEQFAVCLALIIDGKVRLGVLGCPNLPCQMDKLDGERGVLMVAVEGQGAFQRRLNAKSSEEEETPIHVADIADTKEAIFCESVESGHTSHGDNANIAKLLNITKPPIRIDSQCKYAAVARGDADIMLRLPTSSTYVEKIWDHGAGNIIMHEAGGRVGDINGNPLDFSAGRTLSANGGGVIAASAKIFDVVISAVQTTLAQKSQ